MIIASQCKEMFSVACDGSNALLLFSLPVFLVAVQGPAFFLADETDAEVSAAEAGFALTGLIMCTVLFIGYLVYQVCRICVL